MKGTELDRLSFEALKRKQREIRDGFPQNFGLRVHRAISWIGRAEGEATDLDARYLFYWIAFNAAYADERDVRGEREAFAWFFGQLRDLDAENRLYDMVWTRFPGPIRLFLENRFVFSPFWSFQNGIEGYEDWVAPLRPALHAPKPADPWWRDLELAGEPRPASGRVRDPFVSNTNHDRHHDG
jgi:hypothetical protein